MAALAEAMVQMTPVAGPQFASKATQEIERALSGTTKTIQSSLDKAFSGATVKFPGVERGAQQAATAVVSSFRKAGTDASAAVGSVKGNFTGIETAASLVSTSVVRTMERAATQAGAAFSSVRGNFDGIAAGAAAAGAGVGRSLASGAESARSALLGIGNAFDGIGERAASAASAVAGAFGRVAGPIADQLRTAIGGALDGLRTVAGTAGIALGGFLATSLVTGFQRFSTIQDSRALLETILGTPAAAQDLMDQIVGVVTGTPFNLDQFAKAGADMVAFGVEAAKVPGYLTAIGEAAATRGGQANEMAAQLAQLFGQISSLGKITGDDLLSFSLAGVDALTILANGFDVSTGAMRDMISSGAVPAGQALDLLADGIINGSSGVAGATVALGGSMENLRDTLTGAMGGFRAATARLGAAIIEPFGPTLTAGFSAATKLIDGFKTFLMSAFGDISSAPWLTSIRDAFASFADLDVSDVVDNIRGAFESIGPAIAPVLAAVGASALSTLAGALGPIGAFVPQIGLVTAAIGGLIAVTPQLRGALVDAFQGAVDALAPLGEAVLDAFNQITEVAATALEGIIPVVGQVVSGVAEAFTPVAAQVGDAFSSILLAVGPAIESILEGVGRIATAFAPVVGQVGDALAGIAEAALPAIQQVVDAISGLAEQIAPVVEGLVSALGGAIEGLLPGLAEGISGIADTIGALAEALGPTIESLITMAGSIGSTLLSAVGPIAGVLTSIIGLIGQIPAPILTAVAAFAGLTAVFNSIGEGVGGFVSQVGAALGQLGSRVGDSVGTIGASLSGLGSKLSSIGASIAAWAGPIGAGVGAAVSIIAIAMDALGAKQRELEARTKEVGAALGDVIDTMLDSGDAASSSAAGYQALSEALTTAGGDADKILVSLGTLGQNAGDTAKILSGIGSDASGTLAGLAEQFGLTAEEARLLGAAVASTDDQFDSWFKKIGEASGLQGTTEEIDALLDSLGEDRVFQLEAVARALEELQDQGEKVDLSKMVQEQVLAAAGMDALAASALKWALANKQLNLEDDPAAFLTGFLNKLAELKQASQAAQADSEFIANAIRGVGEAAFGSGDGVAHHTEALEAEAQALEDTKKALDEYINTIRSADFAASPFTAATESLAGMTEALFDVPNRTAAVEESLDGIAEAFGKIQEAGQGLDLTQGLSAFNVATEEGRAGLAAMQQLAESIQPAIAHAFADSGGSFESFSASMDGIYNSLIASGVAAGIGADQMELIARAIGLIPEDWETTYHLLGDADAAAKLQMLQGAIGALPPDVQIKIGALWSAGETEAALALAQSQLAETNLQILITTVLSNTEAEAAMVAFTAQDRRATINAVANTLTAAGVFDHLTQEQREATITAIATTLAAQGDLDGMTEEQREATINAVAETIAFETGIDAVTAHDYATTIVANAETDGVRNDLASLTSEQRFAIITGQAEVAAAAGQLDAAATNRLTQIVAEAQTTVADEGLNGVAAQARVAEIVGSALTDTANQDFKTLTDAQRTAIIESIGHPEAAAAAMQGVVDADWLATVIGDGDPTQAIAVLSALGPFDAGVIGQYLRTLGIPNSLTIPVTGVVTSIRNTGAAIFGGGGADGGISTEAAGSRLGLARLAIQAFANGGINAKIFTPAHGTQFTMFNERETGGEAFIPLGLNKRDTAMPVLVEVMRRFGVLRSFADGGITGSIRFPSDSDLLPAATAIHAAATDISAAADTLAAIPADFADFFTALTDQQRADFQAAFPAQSIGTAASSDQDFADFFNGLTDEARTAFQEAFPPGGAASEAASSITEALTPEFVEFFNGLTDEARTAFQEAFPPGSAAAPEAEPTAAENLATLLSDLGDQQDAVVSAIRDAVSGGAIGDMLADRFTSLISGQQDGLDAIREAITDGLERQGRADQFAELLSQQQTLVDGIAAAISDGNQELVAQLTEQRLANSDQLAELQDQLTADWEGLLAQQQTTMDGIQEAILAGNADLIAQLTDQQALNQEQIEVMRQQLTDIGAQVDPTAEASNLLQEIQQLDLQMVLLTAQLGQAITAGNADLVAAIQGMAGAISTQREALVAQRDALLPGDQSLASLFEGMTLTPAQVNDLLGDAYRQALQLDPLQNIAPLSISRWAERSGLLPSGIIQYPASGGASGAYGTPYVPLPTTAPQSVIDAVRYAAQPAAAQRQPTIEEMAAAFALTAPQFASAVAPALARYTRASNGRS